MYPEPSAPTLAELVQNEDVSYGCENGCDVEFHVGLTHDDLIRIPAHSCQLQKHPVFKAMLSKRFETQRGPQWSHSGKQMKVHTIVGVDGKAFDNVMKHVYGKPVTLQAPEGTIIETLKAAHEYLLPSLVRECVKQLYKVIGVSNALFIYANVFFLCNDVENLEERTTTDSLLPLPKRRKHSADIRQGAGLEIKDYCVWLLCHCLAFIDLNAATILESDEMEDLCKDSLKFLLQRDGLDASEAAVFSALLRWAETVCKRQHLPLTSASKRGVLHDLLYVVRYCQMTSPEFLAGPGSSGLLSPEQVDLIKNSIAQGRPYQNSKRFSLSHHYSCHQRCPKHQQHYVESEASFELKTHWSYISRPRSPLRVESNGKRKGSVRSDRSKGGSHPAKLRRVSIVVKNFVLPCATGGGKGGAVIHDSSHRKSSSKSRRRESGWSKAFDYSLRVFAFFFD